MNCDFDNDRPIYIQLVEQIQLSIVTGKYKSGEKIPSVRELSLLAEVTPNTMQKALSELEQKGLIYTQRTNGKYVTDDEKLLSKCREEYVQKKLHNFLKDMNDLKINNEVIISKIREIGKDEKNAISRM